MAPVDRWSRARRRQKKREENSVSVVFSCCLRYRDRIPEVLERREGRKDVCEDDAGRGIIGHFNRPKGFFPGKANGATVSVIYVNGHFIHSSCGTKPQTLSWNKEE